LEIGIQDDAEQAITSDGKAIQFGVLRTTCSSNLAIAQHDAKRNHGRCERPRAVGDSMSINTQ
jgi:hypothetical protein